MRRCGSGCVVFILILLFAGLPAVSSGAQKSEETTPYYTNKDIERYAAPSEAGRTDAKEEKPSGAAVGSKESSEKKETGKAQEYWCKKASSARKTLEKKQERVDETEKEIAERKQAGTFSGKSARSLEKRREKAVREYRHAEQDFAEIGDEAHRKGIPPGWLRCQFE